MPTKEFNNVQLDVTFIQAATRSNITSGEDIATSFGKISKWFTDLKSIAWDGHPTVTQKDTTSTISPNHEETFTVVDSVTRNGEGHVTGINVKTVKLPTGSGYVHPTHDSHTSGLYKITVDELGHVSSATAVTKTDITDLGIPGSDTNTTYTLSGAYGSGSNTWVTTLTPSSGSATTSTVPTASTTAYGITKLSSATNSTSTSLAATASAVKAAYDKANHSHPYLPLTGGTISSSSYGPLTIERTGSTSAAAIVFKNTNGTLGSIGMTGDINGGLFRSDGTTAHTVLDTGNLTSYTYSSTASRTANTVLAAPNGSAGAATFRTLVTADLPASGATAGSYGPSANASPAHSGTFSVPYITINAKGQVTAASTKTITLPASGNTDTKVNVTLGTTTKAYLLGTSTTPTSTATGVTAIADTGVYLDTTAGKLTATTFAGSLSGNATSATRLVVGSVTVQTGSTKKAKITLETLMSWLITKGHIPSNTNCYRVINIGWQYSSNDILQLTTTTAAGTTNYELQLAGVTIEFIGSATNYNTGVFRLRIHSSPTHDGFALTSGYNRFPVSHIAEYYCNGSAYSPTWKVLSSMGDDEAYKVTQSATTASNYRAILMGYNNSTDASTLTTTVTNQVYASSSIYAQPSTGTLYASKYNGYKVGGTPGNWFSLIPVIANDGVMEAGKYIDFHTTNTGTTDYDVRLTAGSGTLTCSGSITAKSFSGNATSASKVNNSLKINNKTFDGSSAVDVGTIGIGYGGTGSTTAAGARGNLGAMASISANGYYGMGTPNGATDQWIRTTSVGIIPYQEGSAGSGHCSIGTSTWYFQKAFIDTVYGTLSGNASSASKLTTARTITLGSGLQGSVSFDGSANVTLNGSLKRCSFMDEASDWAKYPWRKIANTAVGGSYADRSITFMVTNSWSTNTCIGILRAHIRVGGTAGVYETGQLKWLFLTDTAGTYIKPENFVMVYTNNSGSTLGVEIWVKNTARYNGYMFTVLDESHRTGFYNAWSLTTNPTRAASYTSGTGVIISSVSRVLNASQNMTCTELLYSGTGSTSITIDGLSSSTWDCFTVVVMDGGNSINTHNIRCNKDEYTRYCVAKTPSYNASSTSTGLITLGVGVTLKTDTIEIAASKYRINATSSGPSSELTNETFRIVKVYGHKYYYS